jgi:hypothetical protein
MFAHQVIEDLKNFWLPLYSGTSGAVRFFNICVDTIECS